MMTKMVPSVSIVSKPMLLQVFCYRWQPELRTMVATAI
jgi:hypothetical protein